MPILNKNDNKIISISKNLKDISEVILRATDIDKEKSNNDTNTLRNCALNLCDVILAIKDILIKHPYKINKKEFDKELIEKFNFRFDEFKFNDFLVYTVKIPFILPKANHYISPTLLNYLLDKAKIEYEEAYKKKLLKINNPVVFFENRFIKASENKGFKDVDNYAISEFLNCFQKYFFNDDRNVTLINRNIIGAKQYETIVYIVSEAEFFDFYNKYYHITET